MSEWLNRAEQGELLAQYRLGQAYATGREAEGIEPTIGDAIKWWQVAAGQRFNKAVGQLYHYALQGEQRAIAALHAVASEGDPFVQGRLGQLYYQGEGVGQDIGAALKWMQLSAEAGYGSSQHQLAQWYYEGVEVPKDIGAALKWMQLSAEAGYVPSQYQLAQWYYEGTEVPKDIEAALKWMQLSAEAGYEAATPQLKRWVIQLSKQGQQGIALAFQELVIFAKSDNSQVQKEAIEQLYVCAVQGEQHAVAALHTVSNEGNAFAQYQLGQLYYQGKGVEQDRIATVKWVQLSAKSGYKPAQKQLQTWQARILSLESSSQAGPWQRLQTNKPVSNPDKAITNKSKVGVSLSASESLSVLGDDEEMVELGMEFEDSGGVAGDVIAPGGDGAKAVIEGDLGLASSADAVQIQARLTAHQLSQLLGAWHSELIGCVNALGRQHVDADALLQVDRHSGALAELNALVRQSATVDVQVYSDLMKTLSQCVPVYQLMGSVDEVNAALTRLEEVALLVHQTIDIIGQAHWLLRHQVLGQLQVIASEYAVASKAIAEDGEMALRRYQGRAGVAVLGEGYYHVPVALARQLLCIDESGFEVKTNQAGSHAVVALNGVHYKPNSKVEFPINPGKEHAVSSLMQLIAGQSLAAAPSTLLSVSHVPIQGAGEEASVELTGNLVQGGLTVTGMCFKDFIECREALASWQVRLSTKAIVALLKDSQRGFKKALKMAKQAYPSVFGAVDMSAESERAALSDSLRSAFEAVCAGKPVEAQLIDIAGSAGRPEANRSKIFRGLFEGFLSAGGTVDDLRALLGVVGQTSEIMADNDIAGLLQQFKHAKRIVKLLPNTPLAQALTIVPELLTERYLDTQAMSALWLGLLLTIPCDGKFDNFMLQLDYGDDKQLQRCRIVAIDNDLSLKMPFSLNEEGQLSLELKNLLIVLPELMNLPIHPAVRQHCLSMTSGGWYLTWLSVLAKGDSDYQQWLAQGTVSEKALKAIDIPVQLPEQVWQFIKTQWQALHALLQRDETITLGQCFATLYPLVDKAYQGLVQLDSPLPGPLAAEANLYQFFKLGGSCPVGRLLEGWSDELEQAQCADEVSPIVSANQQMLSEVRQLNWAQIPQAQQWPLVEALSLLPGLTLQDWQGLTEESYQAVLTKVVS